MNINKDDKIIVRKLAGDYAFCPDGSWRQLPYNFLTPIEGDFYGWDKDDNGNTLAVVRMPQFKDVLVFAAEYEAVDDAPDTIVFRSDVE